MPKDSPKAPQDTFKDLQRRQTRPKAVERSPQELQEIAKSTPRNPQGRPREFQRCPRNGWGLRVAWHVLKKFA